MHNATKPIAEMTINAFCAKDCNMMPAGKESRVGIQGGFFVVRPNIAARNELVNMVRSGQHWPGRSVESSGWFQSGCGPHAWGSMTIQGLLACCFDQVAHKTSVELHQCKHNQIADDPRWSTKGKHPKGTLRLPRSSSVKIRHFSRSASDWFQADKVAA